MKKKASTPSVWDLLHVGTLNKRLLFFLKKRRCAYLPHSSQTTETPRVLKTEDGRKIKREKVPSSLGLQFTPSQTSSVSFHWSELMLVPEESSASPAVSVQSTW